MFLHPEETELEELEDFRPQITSARFLQTHCPFPNLGQKEGN